MTAVPGIDRPYTRADHLEQLRRGRLDAIETHSVVMHDLLRAYLVPGEETLKLTPENALRLRQDWGIVMCEGRCVWVGAR